MKTEILRAAWRSTGAPAGVRVWSGGRVAVSVWRSCPGGTVLRIRRSGSGFVLVYLRTPADWITARALVVRELGLFVAADSPARVKARRERARREALLCES